MEEKKLISKEKAPFGFLIDCEQSLFFFRFSESNARGGEGRSRETRETRAAAREEKRETLFFRASPVSRHQLRAWPFACLAFCSTDQERRETARSLVSLRFVDDN